MQSSFEQNPISYFENCLNLGLSFDEIFKKLQDNFSSLELKDIYSYVLENKSDIKIIDYIIRKINKEKNHDQINALIDFILRPNLNNDFLNLKVLAIKTIANFQDKNSVSALLYCLNDKNSNYKIKLASAEALGKIGDRNAFEPLSKLVCDEKENSAYIKESAVAALGMLGDTRALDVFDLILNTKQMFLDKFSYLKERIIETMAKFDIANDKRALKILKQSLLDNNSKLRNASIETLMNSKFEFAYDLIK